MICQKCKTILVSSDNEGIEIDYCPKCKGVSIHINRLEKINEQSKPIDSSFFTEDHDDDMDVYKNENHKNYRPYSNNPKHKRGLFSDLLDF